MVVELADGAGRFRPVAGIVDARGDLVGNQAAIGKHEELDADHPDIGKPVHERARGGDCRVPRVRGDGGRQGRGVEDAVPVDILGGS